MRLASALGWKQAPELSTQEARELAEQFWAAQAEARRFYGLTWAQLVPLGMDYAPPSQPRPAGTRWTDTEHRAYQQGWRAALDLAREAARTTPRGDDPQDRLRRLATQYGAPADLARATCPPPPAPQRSHPPLVITADGDLMTEIAFTAELADVLDVDAVTSPQIVNARWHYDRAPLVLVGLDQAEACLRAGLPRRPGVTLVGRSDSANPSQTQRHAEALGATYIAALPQDALWLTARLALIRGEQLTGSDLRSEPAG